VQRATAKTARRADFSSTAPTSTTGPESRLALELERKPRNSTIAMALFFLLALLLLPSTIAQQSIVTGTTVLGVKYSDGTIPYTSVLIVDASRCIALHCVASPCFATHLIAL
jgi:hypothetical protein